MIPQVPQTKVSSSNDRIKRWTAGTLHYRLSHRHLPYYLDEFTFRFNRRNSTARGMLFYRLLQQAVDTDPHPLNELIGGH